MRVCKWFPLLLMAAVVASCSPRSTEESKPATTDTTQATPAPAEPAPAPVPAPAPPEPAPAPAPKPKAPAPAKSPRPATGTSKGETAATAAPAPTPPAVAENRQPAPPANQETPAPAPKKVEPIVIPAGTELNVTLIDALNSGKNKAGDTFSGNLAAPVYANGATVLERGAKVEGKVVAADPSGRVSGKASMTLALTGVMHNGKTVPITSQDLTTVAESTTGRDAKVIGGTAGVGAIIGAITGGKKGAAIGGAIGGAAGTGGVLVSKGKEVDYPAESRLTFSLDKDVSVMP